MGCGFQAIVTFFFSLKILLYYNSMMGFCPDCNLSLYASFCIIWDRQSHSFMLNSNDFSFYLTELFPKPILSASLSKLDENKELTLSCSISGFRKANFSILRRNSNGDILLKNSRNLTMRVNVNDTGSYICKAEVKGIVKESKPVRISVYGE